MTIESLIECDAATLERMTDAELLEHFKSMLDISRPERQAVSTIKREQQMTFQNPKLAQGLALAKSLGFDSSELIRAMKPTKGKR